MSVIKSVEKCTCPRCEGDGVVISKEVEIGECDVTDLRCPPQVISCTKQNDCEGDRCGHHDLCYLTTTKEQLIYNPHDMSIPELEERIKETKERLKEAKEILDGKIKKRDTFRDKTT